MINGKVVILSAPSGAGKTTIVKYLLEQNIGLEFSVSATSRPPRAGEVNGKDYYFIDIKEFKQKISHNEFIEWEEVYQGVLYGTPKSEIKRIWEKGNHVLFEVDVKGGINLKKIFKDKALSVFIMPPSVDELKKRLKNRGTETDEIIEKRLKRAEEELSYAKKFDKIIVNDNLEKAKKETLIEVKNFLDKNSV
jgi:guanylate kinase